MTLSLLNSIIALTVVYVIPIQMYILASAYKRPIDRYTKHER